MTLEVFRQKKMRPLRLLQITDCHLGSTPGEMLLGLDTDQSLYDVLECLRAQESPDIIVVSGDVSNDGGVPSYERFINIVTQFFPSVPLAWLPGNHDDPMSMDQVKNLPIEAHHKIGGWNIILLNSRIPMEEGGDLDDAELARLERELAANPDMPTVVFLHHQPVPVGSEWVDQYVVKSADRFFEIIDRYINVKAISWGHVHQEFVSKHNDIPLLATPSTCIQFVPNKKEFKVDTAMPGYRLFELFPDGTLHTTITRIEDKVYSIDFASTGY